MESDSQDLGIGRQLVALGLLGATDLAMALKKRQEMSQQGQKISLIALLQDMELVDHLGIAEAKAVMEKSVESTEDFSQILQQVEESSVTSKKRVGRTTTIIKKRLRSKPEEENSRYEMLDKIGAGGMGSVYKAHDSQLDRMVAIKFLKSFDNEKNVQRFLREARAIARLKHPNIITVYDIDEEEEQPFFTMDFIEGDSLKELLNSRVMGFDEIIEIMKKITSAIAYAHQQKIIHRDLKPANIMMQGNEPLVMDFGLAKMEDNEQISHEGVVLGTLCYMAPEQADGRLKDIDERSDLYALGVILFEMLTQQLPFTGNSFLDILPKVLNEKPPFPSSLRPDVPKNLEHICCTLLAKKPEQRYQNAEELMQDLERVSRGEVIKTSSSKVVPIAVAAIVVFVVGAGLFKVISNPQPRINNRVDKNVEESSSLVKQETKPSSLKQVDNVDNRENSTSEVDKQGNIETSQTEANKENKTTTQDGSPDDSMDKLLNEVIVVPPKLFDEDLFRRLEGWKKEGNWAPMEDSSGVAAINSGHLQRRLSNFSAVIKGSIHALGLQSREGGLWLSAKDKSVGIHLQVLTKDTYLIQLGYFTEGKIKPPFIYVNTTRSSKGIEYIFLWQAGKLRWKIENKKGQIDWDKPMNSIHLYNGEKSQIRFGQIYFKEK